MSPQHDSQNPRVPGWRSPDGLSPGRGGRLTVGRRQNLLGRPGRGVLLPRGPETPELTRQLPGGPRFTRRGRCPSARAERPQRTKEAALEPLRAESRKGTSTSSAEFRGPPCSRQPAPTLYAVVLPQATGTTERHRIPEARSSGHREEKMVDKPKLHLTFQIAPLTTRPLTGALARRTQLDRPSLLRPSVLGVGTVNTQVMSHLFNTEMSPRPPSSGWDTGSFSPLLPRGGLGCLFCDPLGYSAAALGAQW